MSAGGNVTLELNGNNNTVSWVTHGGGELYGQTGKQIIFTANAVGTYRITGTDIMDKNCSAMATITVDSNCHITPKQATIAIGETQQFSMVGSNCDEITWIAGTGDIDKDTGRYIAPIISGFDNVTATVKNTGYSEKTIVTITPRCLITPQKITLQPNESQFINIISGNEPYTISSIAQGNINRIDSYTFEYTASPESGEDIVTICCGNGRQCKDIEIFVEEKISGECSEELSVDNNQLKLIPEFSTVYKGEPAKIRIDNLGSECDWSFKILQEGVGIDIVKKTDDYIVVEPKTDIDFGTEYQLTCRDENGAEAQSIITIAKLPNDLDSDGLISADEIKITLEQFFNGEGMDRTMLFLHLEAFLM